MNAQTQNALNVDSTTRDRTADLLKLADAFYANLRRGDCEFGGWGLDDKRPFGNSDVIGDVLEIINYPPVVDDYVSDAQEDYAVELYDELGAFLTQQWAEYRQARSVGHGNDEQGTPPVNPTPASLGAKAGEAEEEKEKVL